MMETVEDIPKQAILTGLPWDWEGYGGYLDAIERMQPAINIAGMVGHCAVRFYVMGERAVEEQATPEELAQMAHVVGQSLDDGAVGFSTNRYEPHKLPDGRSIPGTFADHSELVAIAKEVGPRDALMQAVGADFEVLKKMSDTTQGRILFSYGTGPQEGAGSQSAKWLAQLCQDRDITAITQVRGSGFMFGISSNIPSQGPTWAELRKKDLKARLAMLEDDSTRAKLISEGKGQNQRFPLKNVFYLGDGAVPNYAAGPDQSLEALSTAANEHWIETFIRLSRATEGRAFFNLRMFNQNLNELGELFKSEHIFPSLGDAGAHVSQIMDAGWASFTLQHWVRETGIYSLEEGVRRLTSGPARVLGLNDRGTLKAGMKADVNVFDPAAVAEKQPELVHDFPGGAPRYIQKSYGYKNTLVNGEVILEDGELTETRSGTVLRHSS